MKTYEIAPGSLLQRLYLKERLRKHKGQLKTFVELGSGNGYNSRLLLEMGMRGVGFDLNTSACENNTALNGEFIANGQYTVKNTDFFTYQPHERVDLLFSCMVIEHLTAEAEAAYFQKAKECLKPGGRIITLVPGSMAHWGIEDEIAGHRKRYTRDCFKALAATHGFTLVKGAGLTYPLSNWLLPISNHLITKNESHKKELSDQQKTVLSGNRKVLFKTDYPIWMKLMLNGISIYPFHLLQKIFGNANGALILYAEMQNASPSR